MCCENRIKSSRTWLLPSHRGVFGCGSQCLRPELEEGLLRFLLLNECPGQSAQGWGSVCPDIQSRVHAHRSQIHARNPPKRGSEIYRTSFCKPDDLPKLTSCQSQLLSFRFPLEGRWGRRGAPRNTASKEHNIDERVARSVQKLLLLKHTCYLERVRT